MNKNKQRLRYYGKRVGDIVQNHFYPHIKGEIVELGGHDNNRVYLKLDDGKIISDVAEHLTILKKVDE